MKIFATKNIFYTSQVSMESIAQIIQGKTVNAHLAQPLNPNKGTNTQLLERCKTFNRYCAMSNKLYARYWIIIPIFFLTCLYYKYITDTHHAASAICVTMLLFIFTLILIEYRLRYSVGSEILIALSKNGKNKLLLKKRMHIWV